MSNIERRSTIRDYEWIYDISTYWRVKSYHTKTPKILKPLLNSGGYHQQLLMKQCRPKFKYIHVLVAQSFIYNPDGKPEVNHKNSIRTDNNVSNLEWVTRSENAIHAHYKWLANKRHMCVLQYTKRGELVAEYPSIKAARSATGISSIWHACWWWAYKSAWGYLRKYKYPDNHKKYKTFIN